MRYKKDGNIILVYRNKRKLYQKLKISNNPESSCMDCALFELCAEQDTDICIRLVTDRILDPCSVSKDTYFVEVTDGPNKSTR